MKILQTGFGLLCFFFFTSCGGGGNKMNQIQGVWKLISLTNNSETVDLSDCDKQTTWNFTLEDDEALGDGTEVKKVIAKAPDNCKYYGFDAKWTVKDGKLFISSSRIGGMGGISLAGLMEVTELTDSRMVLKIMKNELTFEK